ncbi:MAG: Dabb family protein [Clostridia bacterium]|nr:Dabb family protein [Clostridia bacterium]
MVKHIILWKLKDAFSAEKKAEIRENAKANLEGLVGQIEGLTKLSVHIDGLASSNADMMLDSEFVSEEALKGYAKHPKHVAVAENFVRPFTEVRLCLDFQA